MREGWVIAKLEDMLDYIQPTKYIVSSTNYDDSYKTPVLTAGKSFIKGYTDEDTGIFDNIPVIIFDDFTTATQFVNFKFKVKSSAMKILVPTHDQVNLKYVFYFMLTLRENTDTHKRYWISIFSQLPIPLAPLPEQRAIVAKLDQLFSELDNGIENLRQARAKLEIYRQAVLKKAFEGELTREWREQQTDLPSADELLEQIKAERKRHYEQQLAEWEIAVKVWEVNGKEGKKPGKPKKLSESRGPIHNPGSFYEHWIYLSDLIEYTTSGSRGWAKYYSESGAKFIRAQNLKYDTLDLSDIAFVSLPENAEGTRTLIEIGDLLITITGANVTKCACVAHEIGESYVSQHVALCRLFQKQGVKFLFLFLVSETGGRKQLTKAAYGAGKPGLNLDNIRDLKIPLFSNEEQTQIVQEIESRLSVCDKLSDTIESSLKQAEAQRQSILKKAFEGHLLTDAELAACRKPRPCGRRY